MGSIERADVYKAAHGFPEIDYLTAHVWPLNWGWVDAKDIAGTNEASFAKVRDYIARHIARHRAGQAAGDRGIRLSPRRRRL